MSILNTHTTRLLLICLVLVCPWSISAQNLTINPAEDLYTAAKIALGQAQSAPTPEKAKIEYQSAETWLKKFLSAYPKNKNAAEAVYYLAVTQSKLGKAEEARASYAKFIGYNKPGQMTGMSSLQLALHGYKNKDHKTALPHLNRAIANLPAGSSKTLAHYTRALTAQHLPTARKNYLEDLLYVIEAEDGKAYHDHCRYILAAEYLKAEDYERALTLYELTAKSSVSEIKSQSILKVALLSQKLGRVKLTHTYNALALKDQSLSAHHASAALYFMNFHAQKKNWGELVKYEKYGAAGLSDDLKTKRNLLIGQSYLNLGALEKAQPFLDNVIKSSKGSQYAFDAEYLQLSRTPPAKLDRRKASLFLMTYKTTHANNPQLENVKLLIAESDFANKKYAQAIKSYDSINPRLIDQTNLPTIAHRIIQSTVALGKAEQAKPMIEQFIKSHPKDARTPHLLYQLGAQQATDGESVKAIKTFTRLLSTPDLAQELANPSQLVLAQLLIKEEKFPEAEALYQEIYKSHKGTKSENAEWLFWVGFSQYKQEKYAEAYKSFLSSRKRDDKTKGIERSKHLALCAYNLKDAQALEKELKHHQSTYSTLLPPAMYLYVSIEHYKKSSYQNAWWGFRRAILPSNQESFSSLDAPVLEAYTKTAVENGKYAEAVIMSDFLKTKNLEGYNKAQNLYHSALAHYKARKDAASLAAAQTDIYSAMKINPGGVLKYEIINIAGQIEIELGSAEDGTRLLKQVILLSPQNQDHLKVDALNKLISHTSQSTSPEKENLLKEYKKELEKFK